jgi:hypothetical protein
MERQTEILTILPRQITMLCTVCNTAHFDAEIHHEGEVITAAGVYDGYTADVFKLPCEHFVLFTKISKGGYRKAGEVIGCILDLSNAKLSEVMPMPTQKPDPTHYMGEKQ